MSVVMLFQGETPHPAHRVFGDGTDANYIHFETGARPGDTIAYTGRLRDRVKTGLSVPNADVIIAEGSAPLQTGIVASIRSGATLLYLCADQTFKTLSHRRTEPAWKLLAEGVDGAIAVSELAWRWAEPYLNAPVEVVRPPITNEKYDRLRAVTPSSPQDGPIVTIGAPREHKNFDILPTIADRTGKEIIVLGSGHDGQPYTNHPGVSAPGWVSIEEFVGTLERAVLYVQPSTADACPVAVMEAMLSGTPVLISEQTGVTEIGARSAPLETFVESVVNTLEQSTEKRTEVGKANRTRVEQYTVKRQRTQFREAIERWT